MNSSIPRDNSQLTVLVSGASGYLASHVIYQLLDKGYKVRGTVRSLQDTKKVSKLLTFHPSAKDRLQLVEADLLNPQSWDSATKNIDYVMHVASPLPPRSSVKNENEIIKPAVEGTESVFNAAIKNGVKKIVITSSSVAVFTGQDQNTFNEEVWSNPNKSEPYEKSKHLAERKAWEIYEKNKDKIQLTVMLPGFIQGPSLLSNDCQSVDFISRLMKNDFPAIPKVSLPIVDVRDVAFAHVAALDPEKLSTTNGKRYIINQGSYWMLDVVEILREEFSQYKYKIPSSTLESKCLISCLAVFVSDVKPLKYLVGRMICLDNTKSVQDLGVIYRYHRKTIIESAYDLINKGLVPNKLPKQINPESIKK